jgi:tetratricopeptide (TPR) repeat protein
MMYRFPILLLACCSLLAQADGSLADASAAMDRGRFTEASQEYETAIQTMVQTGVPAVDIFHARVSLSTAYLQMREFRKAEVVLLEAQNSFQAQGRELAALENAWASLDLGQGKLSAAEPRFRRAIEILENIPEASSDFAVVLNNLAAIEMRSGRYAESYDDARQAIELWKKSPPPGEPDMIHGWASLATAEFVTGRYEDAASSLRNAILLTERSFGADHPLMADLLESYAVVLGRLRLSKDARAARKRAAAIRSNYRESQEKTQPTFDIREIPLPLSGVRLVGR